LPCGLILSHAPSLPISCYLPAQNPGATLTTNGPAPEKNKLYYGDNLQVLREYIDDASVDLVYLDPSFNSRQDYNVLFAEKDGSRSASQITAFQGLLGVE
jgi:hypothetical protein